MNPTVSIIVPVYNAESSLSRCVDSILGQEYQDFELLLADDGSTDRSGSICDAYAASDSRVKVIHKSNTGVSDTRNTAISQACGTYLQFLDSDDWITPDATKLFVRAVENTQCDMVIADFYRVVGERRHHRGAQIETAPQPARDVVFAAAFPDRELARRMNAPFARIETEHDFAETYFIETARFRRFILQHDDYFPSFNAAA